MRYALGADISWYPQMLASGFVFRNREGREQDLLQTLKDFGINSIRLRTWVEPSEDPHAGHCSREETLALARLCRDAGFRIMIDFHYGDTWCDGSHQPMPRAWKGLDREALENALSQYTRDVLTLLRDGGVTPEWVQLGNETDLGLALPMGSTEDFGYLSRLYSAGHDAVKAVFPACKTMIQLSEITRTDFNLNYFAQLEKHGCRYDMMGFSYYPYHLRNNYGTTYAQAKEAFERSMRAIPGRFGREFMIVETGGPDDDEEGSCRLMADVIAAIRTAPLCTGLMWWEPEGARVWSDYPLSAWRADGTPTRAMDMFRTLEQA